MDPDSRELLERTRAGDETALQEILRRHLPRLRAFIRLRMDRELRLRESCSDLAQSVCLDLVRAGEGFEYQGEQQFMAWLCISALNKIREKRRFHLAAKRDPRREVGAYRDSDAELARLYATVGTPSRHAIRHEELERLEAAFDEMPDHYREVITLARILGMPHAEIAARMGSTEGAVRVLLNRAMIRLATIMDPGQR